ncbi:MAG: septum formation initiator family protein [Actinomycetia bacterium]|nr:septum formation initiator family protein [Actinomycetes bacterium]
MADNDQSVWGLWARRGFWLLAASALLALVVTLGVLPVRTWTHQQAELDRATERLEELQDDYLALEKKVSLLDSDEEIERQARANYDYVFPGEESYRILPPAE